MTSSSKSEAWPEDRPSSRTGMAVCILGPELWNEPSLTDISDSRSAESQSVVSGDKVKFRDSRSLGLGGCSRCWLFTDVLENKVWKIMMNSDVKFDKVHTVWKIWDFLIIQILREIISWEFRSSKIAVFAILRALKFANLSNFSLQKVQELIKGKIHSL